MSAQRYLGELTIQTTSPRTSLAPSPSIDFTDVTVHSEVAQQMVLTVAGQRAQTSGIERRTKYLHQERRATLVETKFPVHHSKVGTSVCLPQYDRPVASLWHVLLPWEPSMPALLATCVLCADNLLTSLRRRSGCVHTLVQCVHLVAVLESRTRTASQGLASMSRLACRTWHRERRTNSYVRSTLGVRNAMYRAHEEWAIETMITVRNTSSRVPVRADKVQSHPTLTIDLVLQHYIGGLRLLFS